MPKPTPTINRAKRCAAAPADVRRRPCAVKYVQCMPDSWVPTPGDEMRHHYTGQRITIHAFDGTRATVTDHLDGALSMHIRWLRTHYLPVDVPSTSAGESTRAPTETAAAGSAGIPAGSRSPSPVPCDCPPSPAVTPEVTP